MTVAELIAELIRLNPDQTAEVLAFYPNTEEWDEPLPDLQENGTIRL